MRRQVFELPEQCQKAWEDALKCTLPSSYRGVKNVLILGMGGSAIGGDLAAAIARYESPCPIAVCRDYRIPSWVGSETLVVASSYSGNTEETLVTFHQALEVKACCVAVTTGGKLGSLAKEKGIPRANPLERAFWGLRKLLLGNFEQGRPPNQWMLLIT